MIVATMLHAAGEQVLADNEGAENPEGATAVKLIRSALAPGQPFSAVVVIATALPVEEPKGAFTSEEFEVSASHGTVFPELSNVAD